MKSVKKTIVPVTLVEYGESVRVLDVEKRDVVEYKTLLEAGKSDLSYSISKAKQGVFLNGKKSSFTLSKCVTLVSSV